LLVLSRDYYDVAARLWIDIDAVEVGRKLDDAVL
jgi:hypothetical protein